VLARDLIDRTRVVHLLKGYRGRPAANLEAIDHLLLRVSQLVVNLPQVIELDINPVLANSEGVIALDARIKITSQIPVRTDDRLAIRPYPHALEQSIDWMGKSILLRPIRPEDGEMHQRFFNTLDPTDVHSRMFVQMRELQPALLARMTQIDYDREMAFIAVSKDTDGKDETLGVVHAIADPDNENAEFAIVVRSDLKGKGLGYGLMMKLLDYFQRRGTHRIVGEALPNNRALLHLARALGFDIQSGSRSDSLILTLDLQKY
jgi:acetyltransferase